MTHTINTTHTAAVATDYYWIPIDANTPRGVKLQLLGKGGVAHDLILALGEFKKELGFV